MSGVHELSICQSIVRVVEGARQGRTVVTVHLRVGQLRQVVPETLTYCWGLVTETTPLADSRLAVDHIPVVLDCGSCAERTEVAHHLVLTCAACGSGEITLVSGEELEVTSLDLAPRTPVAVPPSSPSTPTTDDKES